MNTKLIAFLTRRINNPTSAHDFQIQDKLIELRNQIIEEEEK
jgi:hypothetical protein